MIEYLTLQDLDVLFTDWPLYLTALENTIHCIIIILLSSLKGKITINAKHFLPSQRGENETSFAQIYFRETGNCEVTFKGNIQFYLILINILTTMGIIGYINLIS